MNDRAHTASVSHGYLKYTRMKTIFILVLLAGLIGLCIFTIMLDDIGLSYADRLHYLFHPDDSWNSDVVWRLTMMPIIGALLAGAALSIAGAAMQVILRNPLASPFTLGISNASAFGAAVGIMAFEGMAITEISVLDGQFGVTVYAFIFAMVAMGVMLLLVKLTECTPETIVLAGLAISSIFSSLLAFMQYIANDTELAAIVYWQFGSLSKISWNSLYVLAAVLAISLIYFTIKRWDYNAMEAGEDVARGLGVKIESTRVLGLVVSAVLTATVVSFMGIIGFIGLIGPHMVKRIIGNDNRFVLVGSVLMGALILLLAYVIGSYAFSTTIPVGIITSAIGGPIFITILLKGRVRRKC